MVATQIICLIFTPKIGEDAPILTFDIFQKGSVQPATRNSVMKGMLVYQRKCDVCVFQRCQDQPNISHAQLDVLDPRLPTRVARPAPAPPPAAPALPPPPALPKKRSRPKEEEWLGM